MNKYIKNIPGEVISFETIVSKCLEKHYMKMMSRNLVYELVAKLSKKMTLKLRYKTLVMIEC